MPRLDILDATARQEFERPPAFNLQQRKYFFEIPPWLRPQLRGLDSLVNQVGFVLQWGYFRAGGRFFKTITFLPVDIIFVTRQCEGNPLTINLKEYRRNTSTRHRQMIRQALGFREFAGAGKQIAYQEAMHLVGRQIHPERLFWSLCEYLRSHRIEVPTYFTLYELISQAIKAFETQLDQTLTTYLTAEQIIVLEELFEKLPDDASGRSIHQLARLKNAQELLRLAVIRENVGILKDLKHRYQNLLPLIKQLNLSAEMIEYYAEYVLRADIYQVKRRLRKHLILICFVIYQYFHVSDILVQTFLQATNLALSKSEEQCDKQVLALQQENAATLDAVFKNYLKGAGFVLQLQNTAFSLDKTREEKFGTWMNLMKEPVADEFLKLVPSVEKLSKQSIKGLEGGFLYQALGAQSRSLMNQIADLLRHLEFSAQHPGNEVMKALRFYQQKGGNISSITKPADLPVAFLNLQERKAVLQGGKLQNPDSTTKDNSKLIDFALYRGLLAKYVLTEMKAARITVNTSHTFKAFEDYLIDEKTWLEQKQTLLERAGLRGLESWPTVRSELETKLAHQFDQTFEAINAGENLFVRKRKKGGLRFITPKKMVESPTIEFFPKDFYVSIFEVLHTVNRYTQFTGELTHRMEQNQQPILSDTVNFAALIGWGCNLGLHHMCKTSNVPLVELERATNWYFSSHNLLQANNRITALMNKLPIAQLLREQEDVYRSASDGQKYTLGLDSIHANYSAKYFGKEKGVTVYSFISEHYPVFYTTVFSAGDFEAWYVLDGLLHHASSMPYELTHSSDTHGVNELNFAITYCLGMAFQPRIKDFHKAVLYGMPGFPIKGQLEYQIKNGGVINTKIIEEQWDTILRFLVTIKLHHAMPSTLLRRLTSYSHQHPLYQALRELGKVVRTTFILQYMHEEETRRRANHQLTKIENMHQLAAELNLGKNGLIRYASKEDLLVMARSKQLLINAMTCWNMLRITQQLTEVSPKEREEMLAAIPHMAPLSWGHFNFGGEYDFSEDNLRNVITLDLAKILNEIRK